MTEIELP